jgi:hypothetical protein
MKMRRLIVSALLVASLVGISPGSAFASHGTTPGEGKECSGITVAEQQVGETPYCD